VTPPGTGAPLGPAGCRRSATLIPMSFSPATNRLARDHRVNGGPVDRSMRSVTSTEHERGCDGRFGVPGEGAVHLELGPARAAPLPSPRDCRAGPRDVDRIGCGQGLGWIVLPAPRHKRPASIEPGGEVASRRLAGERKLVA
jgi:hypothetical protein